MKTENLLGYEVFLATNSFVGGLSYFDFKELGRLGFISEDWARVLLELIHQTKPPEQKEPAILEGDPANIQRRQERRKKHSHKLTFIQVFKPGHYFWLRITARKNGNLQFQTIGAVRTALYRQPDPQLQMAELNNMEYMALLSLSLIFQAKKTYVWNEKILENSAMSEHGIWKFSDKNPIYLKFKEGDGLINYITGEESRINARELRFIFNAHELNFRNCLSLPLLKQLCAKTGKQN